MGFIVKLYQVVERSNKFEPKIVWSLSSWLFVVCRLDYLPSSYLFHQSRMIERSRLQLLIPQLKLIRLICH